MKRLVAVLVVMVAAVGCAGDEIASDATAKADTQQEATTVSTSTTTAISAVPASAVPTSTSTTAAPTTTAVAATIADPSDDATGCGGSAPGGVSVVTIDSGGIERTYRLFVPRSYDASAPLPVVLNFHGLTGTAASQALSSGLDDVADREDFIAIHPQGTKNDAGLTFFEFGLAGSGVDDVGFASDVLDDVIAQLCVDETRLYAMGHSNGAYLSSRLVCDLAGRLAAVTTVSATNHPDDCQPEMPIPLLAFHATGDGVVPFDGGPTSLLFGQTPSEIENPPDGMAELIEVLGLAISDEVDQWAETNGCDGQTASTGDAGESLISYVGCEAPVEFHVIDGGDHGWPGAGGKPGPNATELAWEFFTEHTR